MKTKLLLIVLISSKFAFSQSKERIFVGKIIDAAKVVKDAHIINLRTKKGTSSNDKGLFRIYGKENDSIQISSIGYKTKNFILKNFNFTEKMNFINLEKETYVLDEIILKRHDLSGFLSLDINKTPVDRKKEIVKQIVSDIKKMDFYAISKVPVGIDEGHLAHASIIRLPNTFEGFGVTSGSGGIEEKEDLLLKKMEEEDRIAKKILSELGDDFFFVELKIPKERYPHFFTYCSFKGVVALYKKNELLKVIQIFKKESVVYLEMIEKE